MGAYRLAGITTASAGYVPEGPLPLQGTTFAQAGYIQEIQEVEIQQVKIQEAERAHSSADVLRMCRGRKQVFHCVGDFTVPPVSRTVKSARMNQSAEEESYFQSLVAYPGRNV